MTNTDHYTWRDCKVLLEALNYPPRKIPALWQAAKRHDALVKSDVNVKKGN